MKKPSTSSVIYFIPYAIELLNDDRDFDAMEQHVGRKVYRPA
jgi:hypothetical protein